MFCKNCGREIQEGSAFCPGCGTSLNTVVRPENTTVVSEPKPVTNLNSAPVVENNHINTMSLLGMVISICSLFLNVGGIVSIVGIVLSVIGYRQCKEKNEKGSGYAVAGIIVGAISILLTVLGSFMLLSMF